MNRFSFDPPGNLVPNFQTMKYFFLFFTLAAIITLSSCGGEKVTPSGYQYTHYIHGKGEKANIGDYAFVHAYIYQNDSLVTSTRQMGQTVPVIVPDFSKMKPEDKVPGKSNPLEDAVSVMRIGDSISLDVPITEEMKKYPEMANVKSMVWHVVLVDVKTAQQYQEDQAAKRKEMEEKGKAVMAREPEIATKVSETVKQYTSGALKDKLQTTTSGLKYLVLEQGTGSQIQAGNTVNVHYYGVTTDGKEFDNSFKRGTPYPVSVGSGGVIPGWDEGLALLKKGDKAFFFIPAELGYGAGGKGTIPPNADLIFYIETE
jgi:FKBP-type peptidyl-prolyl cis-trans isomerase